MNYHNYVEEELRKSDLEIVQISEKYLNSNFLNIESFVNGIILEYSNVYGWNKQDPIYFRNPMNRKFDFSYLIHSSTEEQIALLNFSSIYGDLLHVHCTYANSEHRRIGLAKLHMMKLCQAAIDNGFTKLEGYFPKSNKGSIILHLKMGWNIESVRRNEQLFMTGDLKEILERTYKLYLKENS